MKRTDHILAIATALLHASEAEFKHVTDVAMQTYVLDSLRQPGTVSLGVQRANSEVTLLDWVKQLRRETVKSLTVFYEPPADPQGLQPHIAAAFAGGSDLLLQIITNRATSTYTIDTFFAPQYAMSIADFVQLMDAQSSKEVLWSRIADIVLKSNTLNGRSIFDPKDVQDYLRSIEGLHVFENLSSELIKEVQIEATVQELVFVIPPALALLFVNYDSPYPTDNEREYVYLYSLREFTAVELVALVNAQTSAVAVWEQLNRMLLDYNFLSTAPLPVGEWESEIHKMSQEDLERIAHPLLRAICVLCENEGTKPAIPETLASAFGPNALDQKRAAARSKDKDRWSLKPNPNTWEYYAFRVLDHTILDAPKSFHETHLSLNAALEKIQQFAAGINSSYEESFSMSLFLLEASGIQDNEKDYTDVLTERLQRAGFSEHSVQSMQNSRWVVELGQSLGWDNVRINSLLAVLFADVFGGMGSWNDQYVESDQELFQALSANLFDAIKNHFGATLSYP